jgi:hypothetical protein
MKKESKSSFGHLSSSSRHVISRSATPNELPISMRSRQCTPYPLYKQKIGALLKPPDYPRNPPKFMSVREPRSEFEKKEASTQVKLLKKTFNTMYQRFNSVDRSLAILKSEAIKINALRTVGENDLEQLKLHITCLEQEEDQMLNKIRDEFNNNNIYKHVRERMRQTLMYLEVKNQYLSSQIRLRDFLIESEHRKKIKTLENKFTKVQTFKQMRKTVDLDMKDRKADLALLEEDNYAREKIHELRQVRIKKYEEIAETAANEEREGKNNSMREDVLSHAFWAKFLNFKYNFEKKKYSNIEVAFSRIKSETLISNIGDIVTRFLMRENRLRELMITLNQNKGKCLDFLRKNDAMENKIDELAMAQKPSIEPEEHIKAKRLATFLKCDEAKKNLMKLKSSRESIRLWTKKQLKSFSCVIKEKDSSLKELFSGLSLAVRQKIKILNPAFLTEI